jgi:hypothetical protein
VRRLTSGADLIETTSNVRSLVGGAHPARLSPRLVHNQCVDGRVRQRHVGELRAISSPALDSANTIEGIIARRAFWRGTNAALARFADRVDASLQGAIRAALQAQVPMVTPNELRRLSLLGAEREAGRRSLADDSQLRSRAGRTEHPPRSAASGVPSFPVGG